MNLYDLLPTFKVVEVNNIVGLRSGHIIAQAEMAKADFAGGAKAYVENGYILYLDIDGNLKSPGNVEAELRVDQAPILHYTEELFTGISQELKHFAVEWEAGDVCYPRGLVLSLGDAFTTDNYSGTLSGATLAIIDDDGAMVLHATMAALKTALTIAVEYNGPLFHVIETTLPDGTTDAAEFTVIAASIAIIGTA